MLSGSSHADHLARRCHSIVAVFQGTAEACRRAGYSPCRRFFGRCIRVQQRAGSSVFSAFTLGACSTHASVPLRPVRWRMDTAWSWQFRCFEVDVLAPARCRLAIHRACRVVFCLLSEAEHGNSQGAGVAVVEKKTRSERSTSEAVRNRYCRFAHLDSAGKQ